MKKERNFLSPWLKTIEKLEKSPPSPSPFARDSSGAIPFTPGLFIDATPLSWPWSLVKGPAFQCPLLTCESWKKYDTPYGSMLFAYTLQSTNKCYDLMIPFLWDSNYVEFLLRNKHMLFSSWNYYYELQKYLIFLHSVCLHI